MGGRELQITLVFLAGNSARKEYLVWQHLDSRRARGQWRQQQLLWEALCRYMNSGGSLTALSAMLAAKSPEFPAVSPPPGFFLLSTTFTADEMFKHAQHIFANPDNGVALVVAEDDFAEIVLLEDVLDEDQREG